ncbi:hypothetical protein [Polyangium sorediatum]|uniref:HTH HARE-type domain-containing protein n=1 Tax=Polyangium sorediatum TaxID=889274 RepID=A0ABT6P4A5_9BACT|nr:hypothetical protein [Polyangium sorediatum]MDI1435449.1 hypothetical protein [Polyangium sorediatum]
MEQIDEALAALGFPRTDDAEDEDASASSEGPDSDSFAADLVKKPVPQLIRTILRRYPNGLTAAQINEKATSFGRPLDANELHPTLYRLTRGGEFVATGPRGDRTYRFAAFVQQDDEEEADEDEEPETDEEE